MRKNLILPPSGYREQLAGSGPAYDPAILDYRFAYTPAKTGWATALGGDGTSVMFIDAPQLNQTEGGTWPGIQTESTASHGLTPPSGWVVKDVEEMLQLISTAGEIGVKVSRWNGTDAGLAPGLGNFAWMFRFKSWGGIINDDLVKGSGLLWPSSDIENVSGIRLKVNDNFNSQANGLGTDSSQANFYLTPAPVNGEDIFLAYMRDIATQRYYFWYGKIVAGATRANLLQSDSVATTSVFLRATVRNDNQAQRTIKMNENTGFSEICFDSANVGSFAAANTLMGDHFEFLVSTL